MPTNRYNQITSSNRYSPVSSDSSSVVSAMSNAVKTLSDSIKKKTPIVNNAGKSVFSSSPYPVQPVVSPVVNTQSSRYTPVELNSMPQDKINTGVANSTPIIAAKKSKSAESMSFPTNSTALAKSTKIANKEDKSGVYNSQDSSVFNSPLFGTLKNKLGLNYEEAQAKAYNEGLKKNPQMAAFLGNNPSASLSSIISSVNPSGMETTAGGKIAGKTILDSLKNIEIPVGPKTILTWHDLSNITRGEAVDPIKMEAFKKLTQNNTNFIPELKKGNITVEGKKIPLTDYLKQSFDDFLGLNKEKVPAPIPEPAPVETPNSLFAPKTVKTEIPQVTTPHPAVSQINDLAIQNGFKGVALTDKPIIDHINGQTAPTGVDFVNRTIKINQPELENDLKQLEGKGIELPNGDVTHDPNEYINSLVNFEKQHLANATIDDLNILRNGTEAEKTAVIKSLDERAVTSYTEAFPPKDVYSAHNAPANTLDEKFNKVTESLPPDIASTIEPPKAVIEGTQRTPLKQKVGRIDYLRTPWKVFDRLGIRPVYQSLLKGYEGYVRELPKNIDKITAWSRMVSPEGNVKIFNYLDGKEVSLTPVESQVAKEIKTWLGQWADRLKMPKDERISDYITHIFPLGKGGEIPEEIALLINNKIPKSTYNPFLLERKGAPGYIQDTWKALDAYVKRATRKVHMDPALEELNQVSAKLTEVSQFNYLSKYISAINMRPTTLDTLIDNQIKRTVGNFFGPRPTARITKSVRMMISRAKIGGSITSFAKNLTQGVNTFAELGPTYTTRGYIDLVKFGKKELDENGVLVAPFIEDRTYSAVKKMAEHFDNALFLNMNASELVNRGAAYYGAKAKLLNNKVTPKEYREAIGKNMPADYKPTVEDAIAYGKFIAAKTQFLFGPLDTPLALNSDIAKMAAQFQSFGLKQTEFIAKMIGEKEWTKLFRYMLGSMLVFGTIGNAFGMKWQDSFKPMRWGYPPAVQFVVDLYNSGVAGVDKYGRKLKSSERANAFGKTLFTNVVPGGAQIQRSVEGLSTVDSGKSKSAGGTFQYKVNKTPSNYVSGALFGKYNIPESQKYYQKQQDKLKGKKTSAPSSGRYNPI